MSTEKVEGTTEAVEEDTDGGGEEHTSRCFQVSALCCCVPRRWMYLPGRRPKNRKKKNGKNKSGEDPFLNATMFEEKQPNISKHYWSMKSAGDQVSLQREATEPGLTLYKQPYDRKAQDVPMSLGHMHLEEKQEHDEKPNPKTFCGQSMTPQHKEGLDNLSTLTLEREKKSVAGDISEGVPSEETKDYLIMPAKENRHSGRPELLSVLLEEVTYKKEYQGRNQHSISLDGGSYKKDQKQVHQDISLSCLQSRAPEQPNSTVVANEKTLQGPQIMSIDFKDETPLEKKECALCKKEQQLLGQLLHDMDTSLNKQVSWGKMNSVSRGNDHKKDQNFPVQETKQPMELKYPDILSTMCENDDQEQPRLLDHTDFVREVPCHESKFLSQEDQTLITPTDMDIPFHDTMCRNDQKDIQKIKSSVSNTILNKAEEHQLTPQQLDLHAVALENLNTLPLVVTSTMDVRKRAQTTSLSEDFSHTTEQQHLHQPQPLFLEQVIPNQSSTTEKNMQQGGVDPDHSILSNVAGIREKEEQKPVITIDVCIPPDSVSHEKEQQRNLDCADSWPEVLNDKEDQEWQTTLYSEVQPPLIPSKLDVSPLDESLEDEMAKKENTHTGSPKMYSLGEALETLENQSKMHLPVPSKDEEATSNQEQEVPIILPQGGENQEPQPSQKAMSFLYEDQQREQLNLGMTCEEHQKKGKQGLHIPL